MYVRACGELRLTSGPAHRRYNDAGAPEDDVVFSAAIVVAAPRRAREMR